MLTRRVFPPIKIAREQQSRLHRHVRVGSCVTSTVNLDGANCTRDEGGIFEAGSQVRVSSHRELLSLRAMVVSVALATRASDTS
jgi:hypothetical protein